MFWTTPRKTDGSEPAEPNEKLGLVGLVPSLWPASAVLRQELAIARLRTRETLAENWATFSEPGLRVAVLQKGSPAWPLVFRCLLFWSLFLWLAKLWPFVITQKVLASGSVSARSKAGGTTISIRPVVKTPKMGVMVIKGINLSDPIRVDIFIFLDLAQVKLMPLMPLMTIFLRTGWLSMIAR
jgi:hypothetical protein